MTTPTTRSGKKNATKSTKGKTRATSSGSRSKKLTNKEQSTGVIYHARRRAKPKTVQCTFVGCNKWYCRDGDMRRHRKRHYPKEKKWHCLAKGCGKSFWEKTNLKNHSNTHTGNKPFTCRITSCAMIFSDPSSHSRHERHTHGPVKRYRCSGVIDDCKTGIARLSCFRSHWRLMHGRNPTEDEIDQCAELRDPKFVLPFFKNKSKSKSKSKSWSDDEDEDESDEDEDEDEDEEEGDGDEDAEAEVKDVHEDDQEYVSMYGPMEPLVYETSSVSSETLVRTPSPFVQAPHIQNERAKFIVDGDQSYCIDPRLSVHPPNIRDHDAEYQFQLSSHHMYSQTEEISLFGRLPSVCNPYPHATAWSEPSSATHSPTYSANSLPPQFNAFVSSYVDESFPEVAYPAPPVAWDSQIPRTPSPMPHGYLNPAQLLSGVVHY